MKIIKVAINGVGRIGRAFLRVAILREDINVVAINDLGNIDNIAYLLKYDTVYGPSGFDIKIAEDKKSMTVNGKNVVFLSEKELGNLPWRDLGVDVVVESTGFYTSFKEARGHVLA